MDTTFPCQTLPAEPGMARLLGLYPQRQAGLWMQRIRVPGGRLEAGQWARLAAIAERHTPAQPLHLTTRQDLEFHGLSGPVIPEVQRQLAQAELTGLGACGDTLRNVTVCPCSGLAAGAPDLLPLSLELTGLLQSQEGAFSLPRKFKVSLSACPDGCGQPWINDLGLVALAQEGRWRFEAVLAGSLGPRPGTGIAYGRPLEADEVLPFAAAALRVFAANGDRQHRQTARLRHVRERLGDEAFLEVMEQVFAAAGKARAWPSIRLSGPMQVFTCRRVLRFADGNVTAGQARVLGMLAGRGDLAVRIGNHHQVLVFGRDERALADALAQAELAGLAGRGPHVVVCPGTRWCARALTDTARLAAALRERLDGAEAADALIAISGCPNGCAQSAVADIGAVGLLAGGPSQRQEVWNVLAGGQRGRGPRLARTAATRLPGPQAVERMVALAVEAAWRQSERREIV